MELTNYRRVKSFTKYHDTTVLDNGRVTETTADEKSAFISAQKTPPDEVVVHRRMVHKGLIYTSKKYTLSKRREDFFAKLSGGGYGEIQDIVSFPSPAGGTEIAVLFKRLHVVPSFVEHIRRVNQGILYPVCLLSVDQIEQKCIVLKSGDEAYICDFPNAHERD